MPRAHAQRTWPAYAAAAWAVLFALVSLFWGLGGEFGFYVEEVLDDEPSTATVNWIALGLKLAAAAVALALVRPWGRALPRRLLLALAWLAAGVLILHVVAGTTQTALAAAGVLAVEGTSYEGHVGDYVLWEAVWEPFWLLGGVLFALAALDAARRP